MASKSPLCIIYKISFAYLKLPTYADSNPMSFQTHNQSCLAGNVVHHNTKKTYTAITVFSYCHFRFTFFSSFKEGKSFENDYMV